MSHATVGVPALSPGLMSALIPGAVIGGAGFLLTTAAVLAARKLHKDYDQAKCEIEEISRNRDVTHQNKLLGIANKQHFASMMGAAVDGYEGLDSTQAFLETALRNVVKRAEEVNLQEIKARAEALRKDPQADSRKALASYFELNDLLDKHQVEKQQDGAVEQALSGVLDSVRLEIESPLFADPKFEKIKRQLMEQFSAMENIDNANHKLKLQGLENLKKRVRREISESAAQEAARRSEILRRREIVGEAVAMLRAVSSAPVSPEDANQALTLLSEIGAAFQSGAPPRLSDLEGLLSKAKVLFELCEKRLEASATTAYMTESVKEALLGMGYRVSELPAEGENGTAGCMVSIGEDTGILMNIAENGQIHTEMVAFDASASQPDAETEEKVCELVDHIYAALNERNIPIREKTRRHLKSGHTIPVVKRPKQEQSVGSAVKPKARSIE